MIIRVEKLVESKNKFVGMHWFAKAKDTKAWEREIWANCNGRPPRFEGKVKLEIMAYRRRLLDPDNLWIVGLLDALCRLEIIKDDSEEFIDLSKRQILVNSLQPTKTEIHIEEVVD